MTIQSVLEGFGHMKQILVWRKYFKDMEIVAAFVDLH